MVRPDARILARAGRVECGGLASQSEVLGAPLLKVRIARSAVASRGRRLGRPEDAKEEAVAVRRARADLLRTGSSKGRASDPPSLCGGCSPGALCERAGGGDGPWTVLPCIEGSIRRGLEKKQGGDRCCVLGQDVEGFLAL